MTDNVSGKSGKLVHGGYQPKPSTGRLGPPPKPRVAPKPPKPSKD